MINMVGFRIYITCGNEHDSRTFPLLYEKIKDFKPDMMIMDAGYKTPAIAVFLLEDGIQPLFPYKRPMTKEGFFKKYGMPTMSIMIVTSVLETRF